MDLMLLRTFQGQIELQCYFVLAAAQDVNAGLAQQNVNHVFYGIQNLLNAAANISKALWGTGGRLAAERQHLRASIGVSDSSPLRDVVMRNNFEHIDERLDRWWRESTHHNHADLNIGPKAMIAGMADIDMFRAFDPATADITFWGQEFNVQAIVNEVQRILPLVSAEAQKPHWDPS